MEKILRKVKCGNRLPEKGQYQITDFGEIYFDSNGRWLNKMGNQIQPEYWYDEVDIHDLFEELYPVSNAVIKELAKERYEEALELLNTVIFNPIWYKTGKRSLRIAAGLNEEGI